MGEEKTTFDFIQYINDIALIDEKSHLQYLEFLFQLTEYKNFDPHIEAIIKRSMSIMTNIILKGAISGSSLKHILKPLFERCKMLINLRYDNDHCMAFVFASKGSQTLFFAIGLQLMQISSYLINPSHFKARIQEHYNKTKDNQNNQGLIKQASLRREEDHFNNDIMFNEQLENTTALSPDQISADFDDAGVKAMVWDFLLNELQTTLLFTNDKVQAHNKAVIDEVVKSS